MTRSMVNENLWEISGKSMEDLWEMETYGKSLEKLRLIIAIEMAGSHPSSHHQKMIVDTS